MNSDILLNVNDIKHRSRVNGPGLRSVIWVQGCSMRCPGCFNSQTHDHKPCKLLDPEELAIKLSNIPDTVGITISGGEPFEQSHACSVLAQTAQKHGKSVMIFTGFPFKQLERATEDSVIRLLNATDLIVAGPYVQELKCHSKFWRASSNQTVHFLNHNKNQHNYQDSPVIEISTDGNILSYTGFPEPEDLTLFDQLEKYV